LHPSKRTPTIKIGDIIEQLSSLLQASARDLPLELFVPFGSFLEELISPIPSFLVLLPAGSLAQVQGHGLLYVAFLAFLSGIGRLAAALLLYGFSSRLESWLLTNNRSFLGITHASVTQVSSYITKFRHTWLILLVMNGMPIFPTAVLSLSCGFLKIPLRTFALATFFGTIINSFIYMSLSFAGAHSIDAAEDMQSIGQIVGIVLVVILAIYLLKKKITPAIKSRHQ
jgi:membrane protein DedA with SNARE-associated domain